MSTNFTLYFQSQSTSVGDFTSTGTNLSLQRREYEWSYGWRNMKSLQTMEVGLSPVDIADFSGDGVVDLLSMDSTNSNLYGHIGTAVSTTDKSADGFGSSMKLASLQTFGGVFNSKASYAGHGDLVSAGGEDIITISSVSGTAAMVNISSYSATSGKVTTTETKLYDAGIWSLLGAANTDQTSARDELLFYAESTGQLAVWTIGDDGKFSTGYVLGQVTDLNWRPVGMGDIDGNGDDEVLWVNGSNGNVAYWDTDSFGRVTSGVLLGKLTTKNWEFTSVRDLDSDGDADLLFMNKTDGLVAGWKIDGGRVTETKLLGTVESTAYATAAPIDGQTPTFRNPIDFVF